MTIILGELPEDYRALVLDNADLAEKHRDYPVSKHYPAGYFRDQYIKSSLVQYGEFKHQSDESARIEKEIPTIKRILIARGWYLKYGGENDRWVVGKHVYSVMDGDDKFVVRADADSESESWIRAYNYIPNYLHDANAIMELVDDLYDKYKSLKLQLLPELMDLLRVRDYESIINLWLEYYE